MKLAPNTRYAIRLLFELDASAGPLSISALSRRTGLSFRVLENIHAGLKQNGVTDALVGAKGGIVLQSPLDEISLGQVVSWFEEGVRFNVCCGEKAYECPQQDNCATRSSWREVSALVQETLDAVPLRKITGKYPGMLLP